MMLHSIISLNIHVPYVICEKPSGQVRYSFLMLSVNSNVKIVIAKCWYNGHGHGLTTEKIQYKTICFINNGHQTEFQIECQLLNPSVHITRYHRELVLLL